MEQDAMNAQTAAIAVYIQAIGLLQRKATIKFAERPWSYVRDTSTDSTINIRVPFTLEPFGQWPLHYSHAGSLPVMRWI